MNQLVAGCILANQRITTDFPDATSIRMTGSDMHAGQSVHIVTIPTAEGGEEKWVYKPRNLEVDKAVCGPEGMFSRINELSDGTVQLPLMAFRDPVAVADLHTYGYTQFVSNTPSSIIMNETEANTYYRQLGQLVVACMTLGIADIHQDNIMAGITVGTDKKPYIIDAEVSFLPQKIASDGANNIEFAKVRTFGEKLTNNAVISGEDLKHLQSGPEVLSESPHLQAYLHSFEDGALALKNVLGTPGVIDTLTARLNTLRDAHALSHTRLVPLATSEFETARPSIPANPLALNSLCEQLEQSFNHSHIDIPYASWGHIRAGLIEDLQTGNIPIMHFDAEHNAIMYRGQQIGSYEPGHHDISQLVSDKAHRIADMIPAQLFQIL